MRDKLTTGQRGYGNAHQQARRAWQRKVSAGLCVCTRCGKGIDPNATWDLDHSDDRTHYLGAAHTACNRSAGARKRVAQQRASKAPPLRPERAW